MECRNWKLFFYISPCKTAETESSNNNAAMLFFMRPPKEEDAKEDGRKSWQLKYDSMDEILNSVLDLSSCRNQAPENGFVIARSFFAFLEMQMSVLQSMTYNRFPSLGVYYDDVLPIQLPPVNSDTALWTRFYNVNHAFTLAEAVCDLPRDIIYHWTIPKGIRTFAVEYMVRHPELSKLALQWYPGIRLMNVPISPVETIKTCFVFCSREFARNSLQPWLMNPGLDIDVLLVNRKEITRQIEWTIPGNKRVKVHLLVM